MPKNRHITLKVLPGANVFELYAEKKRKDGSTFTSAHVGTIDKEDWVKFITDQADYIRIFGIAPGSTSATLVEQFAFQAKTVKSPFNAAQFDADLAEADE